MRIRQRQGNRAGFTLAELLVVVAIIAVLVAISIPVFGSALERSKAAACMANRRSLLSELTVEYMTEGEGFDHPNIEQYKCPSGGVITYSRRDGKFTVLCSVHTGWNKDTLPNAFKEVFNDFSGKNIDSNAIQGDGDNKELWLKQAMDKLEKAGIDLSAVGAETWSLRTDNENNLYFNWSTVDITGLNDGDIVPVIRYRDDGKYAGQYSVWEYKVTTITSNGATYKVLGNPLNKEVSEKLSIEQKKDINVIIDTYNKYAEGKENVPLLKK